MQVEASYLNNAVFDYFYFQFQLICNFRSEHIDKNQQTKGKDIKRPKSPKINTNQL